MNEYFKVDNEYFKLQRQVSKIVVVNLNEYFKLVTTDSRGPHSGSRSIFEHEFRTNVTINMT